MTKQTDRFYLGRIFDSKKREVTSDPLMYDPDDLTTHAVCVGMTGSGKTGLCIDLLEEAALQGIPALMIDPKGDITNALLHFPEMPRSCGKAVWRNGTLDRNGFKLFRMRLILLSILRDRSPVFR